MLFDLFCFVFFWVSLCFGLSFPFSDFGVWVWFGVFICGSCSCFVCFQTFVGLGVSVFFCLCGVVFASCEVGGVRASTVCTLRVDCFHFGADVGGVFACAFGAFEVRLAACLCVTG
jgi:hypothetical protein